MPAVKILDRKEMLPEGDVMKAIAWKIPESKDFPEGIKYAFAYIHKDKRIFGYDNERVKGHHKHFVDIKTGVEREEKILFTDIATLFRQFNNKIIILRKKLYGGKDESKKS